MNEVVLYDLKLESANARHLPDGRYEVRMRVSGTKQRDGGTSLPMRESVDVGVFSTEDAPLYLAKHALREQAQEITVVVAKEPMFAAVDPYITRIDRNRFDNGKRVAAR